MYGDIHQIAVTECSEQVEEDMCICGITGEKCCRAAIREKTIKVYVYEKRS